ncbi:MAG: MBL fold metallo-hydrolase [Desulfobacteraceae bacterium]|jgi:phosphoribosyl 1,2-cyclic phosphodiesterase
MNPSIVNQGLSVCVLGSGSKGNAIHITDGETAILIDAGLSGKEIKRRMDLRGLSFEALDAIIISHEHSDHIKGAGVLSRRLKVPVYINERTYAASEQIMGKPHELFSIDCGSSFHINDLKIHPFSISHDAADPSGFSIEKNGTKIGLATDLGIANLVVREHLKFSNLLILESNHDPVMLFQNDNYPWPLKQRVKGRKGHLANEDMSDLLAELVHDRLYHVILAHLSEENNLPEMAMASAAKALNGSNTTFSVAMQHEPGDVVHVSYTGHSFLSRS